MEETGSQCSICVIDVESEKQSLNERGTGTFHFQIGNLSNYEVNKDLKFIYNIDSKDPISRIKPWNQSCDQLPIRNVMELLSNCLSNDQENFYFIFSDIEGKPDCDKNNSRNDCTTSTSKDVYADRNGEYMNSTTVEEGADVFGSPLKLEPIADISWNETTSDCLSTTDSSDQHISRLVGIPISESRKILSNFCQIKQTYANMKDSPLKAIVILCENDGMHSNMKNKTVLLGARHDIDGENRKLTTFKVTSSNNKHDLSFLEPLHQENGSVCPMKCSYYLLDQRDKKRKLKVEAYWSNCHGNSIVSNLHTAKFRLHMTAPFGMKEGPLFHLLGRLKHVLLLCNGLKNGELPSVLSTKSYNAVEQLQTLLTRMKNGMQESKSSIKEGGKGKRINLASSYNADITDDLWEIFSQCESYQDMVKCLKMTFNTFKKNEFPLFVRDDNDTLLARLVRQSSNGLIYFPPLTDLMPLKIIADLGLEQMKKIYTAILIKNDLCTMKDIENFLKDSLREDQAGSANLSMSIMEPDHHMKESVVETVKKLHHCVDLVCLADLHTENLPLKTVASHILNHLRSNSLDESYLFVFPLDSRLASQEVEKLTPSMVRREYTVMHQSRVECLVSELPEELMTQAHHSHLQTTTGASMMSMSINESSRHCYKFMTDESVMILGGVV